MFKLMRRNRKGFTLIELIVVIAILAILAAIAIPTFTTITKDANDKVAVANARNIATAINAYNALNPTESDQITSTTGAQTKLETAGLWPSGLTATDVSAAVAKISFNSSDVAIVDTGASPSAS